MTTPTDANEDVMIAPASGCAGIRLAVLIVGGGRGLQPIKHRAFLGALKLHFPDLQVWDVDVGPVRRAVALARSFRPGIERWRSCYNAHPATFRARNLAFAQLHQTRGSAIDAYLQVGATFDAAGNAGGRPVVVYTDFATVLTASLGRFYRLNLPPHLARERIAQEAGALSGAVHICARSQYVAEAIKAAYTISEARVSVVGAGPNIRDLGQNAQQDAAPRLLFIGREFRRKGGDIVLDAFARLHAEHPNARLDIVAPQNVHRPIAGVVWHTAASECDLQKLYAQAQIFVLASRFETWGDVLIEAMTAGMACIVPDKPPLNEIVSNGSDGLAYTPEDPPALAEAMQRLFCDAGLRAGLGAAARTRALGAFSWPVTTAKIAARIASATATSNDLAGAGSPEDAPPPRFAAQIIDNLSIGGAQRLLVMLADQQQGRGGVTILDIDGRPSFFASLIAETGARLITVGAGRISRPRDWRKMWMALRELRGDVVHLHLTNATIFGAPIAWLQGKRVVVTLHNVRTVGTSKPLAKLKYRLESLCLRLFADHIIFVGENVRAANASRLRKVPQTVLPNVMPAPAPVPEGTRERLRAELGCGEAEVVLLSSGRISPQKDHRNLLAAFREVAAARADVQLWIAGDGGLRAELEAEAEQAGLAGRVRFLGARADVTELLAASDVFVLSSAWEGLPLGLLEAMAQGLPAVATNVGDVPLVLAAGGGVLVQPHDPAALAQAILSLRDSAELRRQLAAEALVAVQPYVDVEGWLARTQQIYASLARR